MLWEAIPTALAAAFAPATLLIVTGMLGLKRPILHASVFLAAAAVVTIGIGLLVVLGLLILASAAYVARRPRRAPKEKPEARDMRLLVVVGLGLFAGSPSPLYTRSPKATPARRPASCTWCCSQRSYC